MNAESLRILPLAWTLVGGLNAYLKSRGTKADFFHAEYGRPYQQKAGIKCVGEDQRRSVLGILYERGLSSSVNGGIY